MKHPRLIGLSVALGAGLSLGCGSDPPAAPLVDCTQVTPQKYSAMTIWPLCTSCHSAALTGTARMMAPAATNFDSYAAAMSKAIVAATRVNAGQMPPMGKPQPSAEQKAALLAWASCGTPN